MTNEKEYVKGILKVRGNESCLMDFLVGACNGWVEENSELIMIDDYQYIDGTHNAFIEFGPEYTSDDLKDGIILLRYVQRLYLRAKDLKKLSKIYNVDFRIFAFENRMKNCREIEVIRGKIKKNTVIQTKDLLWQLPCPDNDDFNIWLTQTFCQHDMPTKEDKTPNEFYNEKVTDELRLNGVVPI